VHQDQKLELFRDVMFHVVVVHVGRANVLLVYWFLHSMHIVFYLILTVIIALQAKIQPDLFVNTERN